MKLVWKGIYKSKDQLPKGQLPEHAVKFKEPDSMLKLNLVACLFVIPVILFVGLAIFTKMVITEGAVVTNLFNLWGILFAFLMILPHEFLHAIVFPKDEEVELWVSPKDLMAFVVSTAPVSKGRFIFLSLLPNLVFGLIPLLIWVVIPQDLVITDILFTFSVFSLLLGIGDYLNVYNATLQMPRGSVQQLSGMNSYWYMPKYKASSTK